jgi:hypothetical protein
VTLSAAIAIVCYWQILLQKSAFEIGEGRC